MPVDKNRYPKDWKKISLSVRESSGQKCEFCGVENHAYIIREGESWRYASDGEHHDWYELGEGPKVIRVVLTVAHLNHDTTDNRRENLRALCQKCHLSYDADLHKTHAAATRHKKKISEGQGELWESSGQL